MTADALAFWVTGSGTSELRREPLAPRGSGQVLVRTLFSGISRGTEALVFHGRVPVSEYTRMRCPHQAGEFPAPVKYGYSNIGVVVEGQDELRGKPVFCLYPHQTAFVVPESSVTLLPDGVPAERAVLAANLETAINALWDARPLVGDRISIVGAGVVGAACGYLARQTAACDIELVDLRPERRAIAAALGIRFATPADATAERDLVIHASGSADGLRTALSLAGTEATVVELSWFGDREITLPLGREFHARRLTLRSSQVGRLSPHARARQSHRSRLELALGLCRDATLDVLIDGESAFSRLPETVPELLADGSGALCHRVRYD
jgi:NADPH:quinone reductase-like Zn-dependent oxidoreductase